MDKSTHSDQDKIPFPIFYAVCLLAKQNDLSIVKHYRSVWLKTNDTTHPKTNLEGKVYYFNGDGDSCTAVEQKEVPEVIIRKEIVEVMQVREKEIEVVLKQSDLRVDHDLRDVVYNLQWLSELNPPSSIIKVGVRLARVFYGASLSEITDTNNIFPRVIFYQSEWLSPVDPAPKITKLSDTAYYFIEDGTTSTKVTEPDVQNDGAGGHNGIRLSWVQEKNPPGSLVQKIEERFKSDGLDQWEIKSNAYGLVDEKTFRENSTSPNCTVATIDERILFLPSASRVSFKEKPEISDILVMEASVVLIQNKEHWRVDKVHRRPYADPAKQGLNETSLSALTKKINKPFFLLSRKWIVEHCAQYADGLTRAIVHILLNCELQFISDKARSRISKNLLMFTYNGDFIERNFEVIFGVTWLEMVMVGADRLDRNEFSKSVTWLEMVMGGVDRLHRNEFYKTVQQHSCSNDVKELCAGLALITNEEGEKNQSAHYDKLIATIEKQFPPTEVKDCFLFLFNFLGLHFLVGIPPSELQPGSKGNNTKLDVVNINPVLLKTSLEGRNHHLGKFDTRVKTVRVFMKEHLIDKNFPLRVAVYEEDVTKTHLIDYDNELLKDVLQCRTPFHERRLLQMLGVPCRQALGDVFFDRMTLGKHLMPLQYSDKKGVRTYQSRDTVVLEEVKNHVSLDKDLAQINSADDLDKFLSIKRQFNLLGKMVVLRKMAPFHQELEGNVRTTVTKFEEGLRDQGHILAASLCNTVLEYSGKGVDAKTSMDKCCKAWVAGFWKEITECFPDNGLEWIEDFAATRNGNYFRKNSVYTLFVIASMFDRQITTFYEASGKYLMPHDSMVWAVNSVHRLQMMSALLPMCCGDWVCTHTKEDDCKDEHSIDIKDYDAEIKSRRLWWDYRLAAVAKPRGVENQGVDGSILNQKFTCSYSECRHASEDAALLKIGLDLGLDKKIVMRHLQKLGWWFNGLMSETLHQHFRCNKCQTIMTPQRDGTDLNKFSCPNGTEGHDKGVYLSWCSNSACNHVIDSRIDKNKCSHEQRFYKCNVCGSCPCIKSLKV